MMFAETVSTDELRRRQAFAQRLRDGEEAYFVDGERTHSIPVAACKGRVGMYGKTFTGFFDEETGLMRFDCAEEPSFWFQVDMSKIPRFAAAPGGALAQAAARDYAAHAAQVGVHEDEDEDEDEDEPYDPSKHYTGPPLRSTRNSCNPDLEFHEGAALKRGILPDDDNEDAARSIPLRRSERLARTA